MARRAAFLGFLAAALTSGLPAPAEGAIEIWTSDDGLRTVEFSPSLKLFFFGSTGFLSAPSDYTELRDQFLDLTGEDLGEWPFPEVGGGTLGRVRLRFLADLHRRVRFVVHYEHRPRVTSHGRLLSAASSSLQGDENVPLRITPLQWTIVRSNVDPSPIDEYYGAADSTFGWDHEIDRLFFAFTLPKVDITVGRQAVGWGMSRLWSPLDVFAPLTATDIDREERRGIDALRLTFPFSATSLMEVVVAAGTRVDDEGDHVPSWDESAVAWMLRWNIWSIEWMLMAGKLGPDTVVGGAINGQIQGVAVRGEITATTVDRRRQYDGDRLLGVTDEGDETNVRATVGVEFGTSFDLTGVVEYHYNGFGELRTGNYFTLVSDEQLAGRMARGLVSGMAQHYLGAVLAWQPLPMLSVSLIYIQNLQDGSLILGPAVEYIVSDAVRLSLSGFIPIGRDPEWQSSDTDPIPTIRAHSEFGLSPQLYVLQLRVYI